MTERCGDGFEIDAGFDGVADEVMAQAVVGDVARSVREPTFPRVAHQTPRRNRRGYTAGLAPISVH